MAECRSSSGKVVVEEWREDSDEGRFRDRGVWMNHKRDADGVARAAAYKVGGSELGGGWC